MSLTGIKINEKPHDVGVVSIDDLLVGISESKISVYRLKFCNLSWNFDFYEILGFLVTVV